MTRLIPVILSGGAGARLWPVSREALPKPFIRLADGESLLQKTLRRALSLGTAGPVLTVTNVEYFFLTRDDYADIGFEALAADFLLEPTGRNTAPAIAVAARCLAGRYGNDALMLTLPADHLIEDSIAFADAVARAIPLAKQGWLVTFGVKPTRPDTGYGYIAASEPIAGSTGRRVAHFVEKPDLAIAERWLAEGSHSWNSGMFCFAAGSMLNALRQYAPDVLAAIDATMVATHAERTPITLDAATFNSAPDISIDYAVMERAANVAVVEADFDWSDVGSWNAIADLTTPDDRGNRINGNAVAVDSDDCFIQSDSRLIAMIGLKNLLVVDTPDALLVADRGRVQDVKSAVRQLKAAGHHSVRHHRTVHRPWGSYTVLEEGPRYKIKCIIVKPGASLSLQRHRHRSEHWIVVTGTARVINGEHRAELDVDQSTYIPAGTLHRLSNPGIADCVLIEVQTGDYLGEDDITRLDDHYSRQTSPAV